MLTAVDYVQPSTEQLAHRVLIRTGAANVMKAIHPYHLASLLPTEEAWSPERALPVGYMASKSHARYLDVALPAIISLMEAQRTIRFEIFGTLAIPARARAPLPGPDASLRRLRRLSRVLRRLAALGWSVGLAPLLPTPFNACKSAIKYLEYIACGIPTVAPAVPADEVIESGRNGLVADGPDRWSECIRHLLNDRRDAAALVHQPRDCEAARSRECQGAAVSALHRTVELATLGLDGSHGNGLFSAALSFRFR